MTEMSRERREELEPALKGETIRESVDAIAGCNVKPSELRALLRDSAWRERVESNLSDYREGLINEINGRMKIGEPMVAEGLREALRQLDLRAIVDTNEHEET